MTRPDDNTDNAPSGWKPRLKAFHVKIKSLKGDPHYVALGMAVGVFVSVTPTIPFHTVIALVLAFALKASKPAAVIGVWFSNPITIPPFYYGSYKLGMLLLGRNIAPAPDIHTLQEMLKHGLDITFAMILGGALLGILPAIGAYFLTRHFFRKLRVRRAKHHQEPSTSGPDAC
jgi:uncharacterized protein (DUF2062 family)